MSNLVIVAIPDENDRVWKVSSEKIPHLTLLFLGDADQVGKTDQIVQFVEHAANTTLQRFYLPVDRRGELGEDKADVLFFKKGRYDYKAVRDFRVQLLKDNNIRTAYDSTEQFDGPWQPHLTLGYPTDPAKPQKDNEDYPFYDVSFNRIAVWVGDFDGPEFLLKDYWDEYETMDAAPLDMAMGSMTSEEYRDWQVKNELAMSANEEGAEFLVHRGLMTSDYFLEHHGVKGMRWGVTKSDAGSAAKSVARVEDNSMAQTMDLGAEFIEHFGVKGMRWGQRRAAPTAVEATSTIKVPHGARRKTKIKVEGGENHDAHDDAVVVAEARAKLKKSGVVALSNNELRTVAQRLQLETQVAQLTSTRGRKFIDQQLESQGKQGVQAGVAGVRKYGPTVVKKGAKRASKAAATGAVGLALL